MNSQIRVENLLRVIEELKQKHNVTSLAKLANVYDINPTYISQLINGTRGFGEKAARKLEGKLKLQHCSLDALTDIGDTSNISISGDNTGIIGGIGNTQNNYELEQTVLAPDNPNEPPKHLKDMPILNIDDGVKFALDSTCLDNLILNNAERTISFIPHSGRTFGIKLEADIISVTPSALLRGDMLIVEPCIRPTHDNLVLMCLEYDTPNQRGMIARLLIDPISNQRLIKYNDGDPAPLPANSVICGVIIRVERDLLGALLIKSKMDPEWDILNTLVESE